MTTLERVRAEIEQIKPYELPCDKRTPERIRDMALDIIDKYAEQDTEKIVKCGWTIIPKCTTCKYLYSPIVPCSRCKDNSEFEPQESEDKE